MVGFESLEGRRLLTVSPVPVPYPNLAETVVVEPVSVAGDELRVRGTAYGDVIHVAVVDSSNVDVVINGEHRAVSFVGIRRIVINGSAGDDRVSVDTRLHAPATIYGEGGNDTLAGASAGDALYGGLGNDSLTGNNGSDALYGNDGNDKLSGGLHYDSVFGEAGNDTLWGGLWADEISGGDGLDVVSYNEAGRTMGVSVILGGWSANGQTGERDVIRGDVESAEGTAFGDTLLGSAVANTLNGLGGNDSLWGYDGNDYLYGGRGNDDVDGGDGDDHGYGEDGDDYLLGRAGSDHLHGGWGNDKIHGAFGNDFVHGNEGNDLVWGEDGDDAMSGGDGSDSLYAGAGRDNLDGGAGDDVLITIGGGADDSMFGRSGRDAFWSDSDSSEVIWDADAGETADGFVHRVEAFGNATSWDSATDTYTFGKELNGGDVLDPRIDAGLTYRNFAGSPLFAARGPHKDDVDQRALGDCWFLAPLSGVAKSNPTKIRNMVVALGDGTFAVRFLRGATERYYRVDADLAVDVDGMVAYAGPGAGGSIWVPILEKAFVYARASAGEGWVIGPETIMRRNIYRPHYQVIAGGWPTEAFGWLGGSGLRERDEGDFDDGYDLFDWVEAELAAGRVVTYCTPEDPGDWELVGLHCYLVDGVAVGPDGQKFLMLRNPWGEDGGRFDDGLNDGYIALRVADAMNSSWDIQSAAV